MTTHGAVPGNDPRAAGRDRDPRGRAHNARPRDRLGRPLARGAVGQVPPGPDDDVALTPGQALDVAHDLLVQGWPFRAHEILEAAWKSAPRPERGLWKGLAQLAVGVTHAARGNTTGAVRLLERGADAIEPYAAGAPHDIDVTGLLDWAAGCACILRDAPRAAARLDPMRLRRSDR